MAGITETSYFRGNSRNYRGDSDRSHFLGWNWVNTVAGGVVNNDSAKRAISAFLVSVGEAGSYLVVMPLLLSRAKRLLLGNPVEFKLKQYIRSPNYEDKATFIEQFDTDLERITKAFAKNRRIYVFIDDLDRAEVPKAAELMKAISMMIPCNPNTIFILGMDREKVAAGLAVKHEKLLPYIGFNTAQGQIGRRQGREERGLEYGYNFIEKFIQLPVAVPRPGESEIAKYLDAFDSPQLPAHGLNWNRRVWVATYGMLFVALRVAWSLSRSSRIRRVLDSYRESIANSTREVLGLRGEVGESATRPIEPHLDTADMPPALEILEGDDTSLLKNIVSVLASALDYNPRRVKHFVNLFRLRAYTAAETGLLAGDLDDANTLTLEQLAKFVAITIKWPLLINELEYDPLLLAGLFTGKPVGKSTARETYWSSNIELIAALRLGSGAQWSMENVDISRLTQALPQVRTVASAAPPVASAIVSDQAEESGRDISNSEEVLDVYSDFSPREQTLLRLLEGDPRNFEAHLELADIWKGTKQYKSALEHYDRAGAIREDSAKQHAGMTEVLIRLNLQAEVGMELEQALRLDKSVFASRSLSGAQLTDTDLSGADLTRVDLSKSQLSGARLLNANLAASDLSNSILIKADFQSSNLLGARIIGADFADAILLEARGTDREQLAQARSLVGAIMPDGSKMSEEDWIIYKERYGSEEASE